MTTEPLSRRSYFIELSSDLAERYTEWSRVDELPVTWFKVIPHDDDGTAEVWLKEDGPRPTETSHEF